MSIIRFTWQLFAFIVSLILISPLLILLEVLESRE